jgi:hypothetical protein
MIVPPKCPKCENGSDQLDMKTVTMGDGVFTPVHHGFAACCKRCHTILGVFPDPIDVSNRVIAHLSKKK